MGASLSPPMPASSPKAMWTVPPAFSSSRGKIHCYHHFKSIVQSQEQTCNAITSLTWLVGNMLAFSSSRGKIQVNHEAEIKVRQ